MTRLQFQEEHYQTMLAHISRCLPEEACGLLVGEHEIVKEVYPITNRLHSATRFEMEPKEQLEAFKHIDNSHLELVGIFHSHPDGPVHPSETDIRSYAYPDVAYLIWSKLGGIWRVSGFTINADSYIGIDLFFPGFSNPNI